MTTIVGEAHSLRRYIVFGVVAGVIAGIVAATQSLSLPIIAGPLAVVAAALAGIHRHPDVGRPV
jgi:hypothetical protein